MIVSPEIEGYDLRVKGKSVLFSFPEDPLIEDITYIINFGNAIVDITVGNPVSDFRLVFSTGDVIDSLSFSGNVYDATTGKPVEDAIVLMHENLSDTAVTTLRPLYVARSNADGSFKLDNLKSDTFQVFAIVDRVANYIYEPENLESIAFIDSLLLLKKNNTKPVKLYLSKPILPLAKKGFDITRFGRIAIGFNLKAENVALKADDPAVKSLYSFATDDSLLIWYNRADTVDWNLILTRDSTFLDTISVLSSKIKDQGDLELAPTKAISTEPTPTNPYDTFRINFNYPISRIDTTKINLNQDSSLQRQSVNVQIDKRDKRIILVDKKFKEESLYKLQFLPGAFISLHQRTNDSLTYQLQMQTREDLSNFNIKLLGLDSTKQYVYSLSNKAGDVLDEKIILGDTSMVFNYPYIVPAEYSAKLIFDTNQNGKWDPGDFNIFRQPEKVKIKTFEKLLANFDREEEWKIEADNK